MIFNLAILGVVAIGFLQAGGGNILSQGFSTFSNAKNQVDDVFQKGKTGSELKKADRSVEDA